MSNDFFVCRIGNGALQANFSHANYEWCVIRELDYWGDITYAIEAHHKDEYRRAFTAVGQTMTEACEIAISLEKAVDELFEQGERLAKKYDMTFFDGLFANIASTNWYLEG